MYIKKIKLINFRNYKEQEIILDKNINLLYGNNAQGKTNVLESIFLCTMGKSFRARSEKELISFEEKQTYIQIEYEKKDRSGTIKYEIGENKKIFLNNVLIKKMSDLLGNINIVLFSPEDINIIKDGPSERRRFLNLLISQLRPNYVYNYNLYLKVLEQRNNYLKTISLENKNDSLLEIYNEKLAEYGEKIYKYREEFINKLKDKIKEIHLNLSEQSEIIKIKYISDCFDKEEFINKLKANIKQDILKGYTGIGIQRDDIYFFINGKKVDIYGSQGQQRSAILSLKLAELEVIKDDIGEYPILLLDDFMSELDNQRRINFLKNTKNTQIIITCTEILKSTNLEMQIYKVENGKVFKE